MLPVSGIWGVSMIKLATFRIVAIYAFVGALWILFSDLILSIWTGASSFSTFISIGKGFAYVSVTTVLLYWLIYNYFLERKKVEDALRESEAKFRALAEASPTAIFIARDGRFIYLNPVFERMTGYSMAEGLSMPVINLIHPELKDDFLQHLQSRPAGDNVSEHFETRILTKDNQTRWVYYTGIQIVYGGKPAMLGNVIDISERKLADDHLLASLAEKEVLLKEIHHRVKNNLQIVSSLLSLQSATISDSETILKFRDSQNRIRSMALIHEKLYKSGNLSVIDISDYLTSLISYLHNSYVMVPDRVRLELAIDNIPLKLDSAIPCGLIVNELVTNSFKYAFPGDRTGKVAIKLHSDTAGTVHLSIADDGIGLPDGMDVRQTTTLGILLVNSLVDQLGGTLIFDGQNGAAFHITFREETERRY